MPSKRTTMTLAQLRQMAQRPEPSIEMLYGQVQHLWDEIEGLKRLLVRSGGASHRPGPKERRRARKPSSS